MPEARAVAFESSLCRQILTKDLAALNNVGDRLDIHGVAELPSLESVLHEGHRAIVVCDIEGERWRCSTLAARGESTRS